MKTTHSIESQLVEADYTMQWQFCVAICQKLKENYRVFSEQNNFGNVAIFEEILAMIDSQQENIDTDYVESRIDEICPDMDDFSGDLWASLALDACSALSECAFFAKNHDKKHLKTISTLSLQSAEFKILESENWSQSLPNIQEKLATHPKVLQEISFQEKLLFYTFDTLIQENAFLKEKIQSQQTEIENLRANLSLLKGKNA